MKVFYPIICTALLLIMSLKHVDAQKDWANLKRFNKANSFPWSKGIEPADSIIELNRRLKIYAEKKHHIYLDYYTPMVDAEKGLKSIYADDPVHPYKEGYKVMEPLVEKAIKKAK